MLTEGDFEREDDVCASIIIVLLCFKYDVQFRFENLNAEICCARFHMFATSFFIPIRLPLSRYGSSPSNGPSLSVRHYLAH